MSHMPISSCAHMTHVSIYALYEPNAINSKNRNSGIHTFYMMGPCPRTNMHAKLYMCVTWHYYCILHTDPTKQTATLIYHVTATCAPKINNIYHVYTTYANKFRCIYQKIMSVYIPHMNSLQATVSSEMPAYLHFTLLAYAPEHIYLPHHTYMSHCTGNTDYTGTHINTYVSHNRIMKCNFIYHAITIYVPPTNMPFKCHIYAICLNFLKCICGKVCQYICYIRSHCDQNSVLWEWAQTD